MQRLIALSLAFSSLFIASVAGASPSHVPAPRNNWILHLNHVAKSKWLCILWAESRSTLAALNLTDNNPYGSSGIFQIEQATWRAHQLAAGVPVSVHVWQASVGQQFAVARAIWLSDGFLPWSGDHCP